MKVLKYCLWVLLPVVLLSTGGYYAWMVYGQDVSNPHNYDKVSDIKPPRGFKRITSEDPALDAFLRSLPLKERGTKTQLFTGGDADRQMLNYAVINMPMISNAEQCADVCMRLRTEFLFQAGRLGEIHFSDIDGGVQQYEGGTSRNDVERFLSHVYEVSNTFSLSRELATRPLRDIRPGDIFVYAAADRVGEKLGHAVTVIDVARNPDTGQTCFLLAEGNTPARNIHVVRNLNDRFLSPWFMLNEQADTLRLSTFSYVPQELKHF